jgi:hypothetical protein
MGSTGTCVHLLEAKTPVPLQPGLEQGVLASRYALCSTEAPKCLDKLAAIISEHSTNTCVLAILKRYRTPPAGHKTTHLLDK